MQLLPTAKFDFNSQGIVETYDDLPLWSAKPGALLLENVDFATNKTILDIGSGTGFPVLILAERFGITNRFYALDIWQEGLKRLDKKIKYRQLSNVKTVLSNAEKTPFDSAFFDIITANLAINNFEQPEKVIQECHRILKDGGHLYISTNLRGTFKEFYAVFNETLKTLKIEKSALLENHINERLSENQITTLCETNGFELETIKTETYHLRFANGSAFLNDYFINMAFLPEWVKLIDKNNRTAFFSALEQNLNKISEAKGELSLSVPLLFACFRNKK